MPVLVAAASAPVPAEKAKAKKAAKKVVAKANKAVAKTKKSGSKKAVSKAKKPVAKAVKAKLEHKSSLKCPDGDGWKPVLFKGDKVRTYKLKHWKKGNVLKPEVDVQIIMCECTRCNCAVREKNAIGNDATSMQNVAFHSDYRASSANSSASVSKAHMATVLKSVQKDYILYQKDRSTKTILERASAACRNQKKSLDMCFRESETQSAGGRRRCSREENKGNQGEGDGIREEYEGEHEEAQRRYKSQTCPGNDRKHEAEEGCTSNV